MCDLSEHSSILPRLKSTSFRFFRWTWPWCIKECHFIPPWSRLLSTGRPFEQILPYIRCKHRPCVEKYYFLEYGPVNKHFAMHFRFDVEIETCKLPTLTARKFPLFYCSTINDWWIAFPNVFEWYRAAGFGCLRTTELAVHWTWNIFLLLEGNDSCWVLTRNNRIIINRTEPTTISLFMSWSWNLNFLSWRLLWWLIIIDLSYHFFDQ